MKFSTVIFDLDGTVLNNEEAYAKAFTDVLVQNGVSKDKFNEFHPHITGIGLDANWVKLKEDLELKPEVVELVHQTQTAYLKKLNNVGLSNGFIELVEALREEGIG